MHDALRRHPWACPLLMSPGRIRPARLQYMDALLGRLRDAGFSAETTYHAYHVLDAHIFGFSLWEASHTYNASRSCRTWRRAFERLITRRRVSAPARARPSSTSAKARTAR